MLTLKPQSVALLYDYLRSFPPFASISKMPPAAEVEFHVVKDRSRIGWWSWQEGVHRISISANGVSQTATLAFYLGHEMCHVAVDVQGLNTGGGENVHNAAFRKLAARFCKVHGFDLKAFY
ncbi:hypothetical protein ACRQ5Q_15265 [Bradyrhizobium sp. PMVTL-01]|uniref:hypothetical protein n=1 Tax=Bradyrhizobium sp. PMVTL-01 TaxID=3434999 RepID=UPI003F72B75D